MIKLCKKYQKAGVVLDVDSGMNNMTVKWATSGEPEETSWSFNLTSIAGTDFNPPNQEEKPVIYLYPDRKTDVTVSLDNKGGLTCVYPSPDVKTDTEAVWNVTADKDGTITKDGQMYNYLYWEGRNKGNFDFSKGFCVKGSDTAAFLDKALEKLGLNRREANEFIVYWLPQMEKNEYNVISFQTDAYTRDARLHVDPEPDTMIRVFMAWYGTNEKISLPEQELSAPERKGFTVVEWGGSKVR